jgi:MerR family transcriptional regulator, light-induced transcriptional regulator
MNGSGGDVQRNEPATLSIGALSKATGVPVATLRTWERRYGFPQPHRTPSGHRRYPLATVERIRLAARALEMGHRPATIMAAEVASLRRLLEVSGARGSEATAHEQTGGAELVEPTLADWHRHVLRFDANGFERALRRDWSARGAMGFLEGALGPFLVELGERWGREEISVSHEHFASERVRDFMSAQWRPLSDTARGPRVVCATLPGEQHTLGLHMAAVVLALADVRVVFLGADTPTADLASAAHDFAASAVVLSLSQAADPQHVATQLAALRRSLDAAVPIFAGGTGGGALPESVERLDFNGLRAWVQGS